MDTPFNRCRNVDTFAGIINDYRRFALAGISREFVRRAWTTRWRTRPRCDGRTFGRASLSVAVRRLAVSEPAPVRPPRGGKKRTHPRGRRRDVAARVENEEGEENAGVIAALAPGHHGLSPTRSGSLEAGSSTKLYLLSLSPSLFFQSPSVSPRLSVFLHPHPATVLLWSHPRFSR